MTRHMIFKSVENNYVIIENEKEIFSINKNEMQFDAQLFYNGLYSNSRVTTRISMICELAEDDRKGHYVFKWLLIIISRIADKLGDSDESNSELLSGIVVEMKNRKKIPFFDLPVCAGNGLYTDSPSDARRIITEHLDADYAVQVSGHSMEPLYFDKDILLVKRNVNLIDGDVAIIIENGESYCRKLCIHNGIREFVAVNEKENYKPIPYSDGSFVDLQGKVIGTHNGVILEEDDNEFVETE